MNEFDLIVVGGSSGTHVAQAAAAEGWDVAVIERGPLGGACVTRGCVPSKMLIHAADIAQTVREAERFGIGAAVTDIDFGAITEEVTDTVFEKAETNERTIEAAENVTLYKAEAQFTGERTLAVSDEELRGETVVVAAGARPAIPPIDGLDGVPYLTSTEALRLDEQPAELVIIGGGYIAVELGHLFSALGTDVTLIEMLDSLVSREDRDIREAFEASFRERHTVYTGYRASEVVERKGTIAVRAENEAGEEIEVSGDQLLVAVGRRPNTDTLAVERAGIAIDDRGYIKVDEYLETSAENVWASGDIIGGYQFKHTADYEARYVAMNAVGGRKEKVDYTGMAHAIFSAPQVAGVGKTEDELEGAGTEYVVGRYEYTDVPMGLVLKADDGFVKVLADPESGAVLGCHILGPDAAMLMHQVLVSLRAGTGTVDDIVNTVPIHPAMNEVLYGAFNEVSDVPYTSPPYWGSTSRP